VQVPIKTIGCRRFAAFRLKTRKSAGLAARKWISQYMTTAIFWLDCHPSAAGVSIHSAVFAAFVKAPLTVLLRYCLTIIGNLRRLPGSAGNRGIQDRVLTGFVVFASVGAVATAPIG
jgi:hypothetical protein